MPDEEYRLDLENLKKLHIDLEKQMLNFDEVIPFERQRTAQIYSPRLLNMMLVCGAQIDAVTRLIARRCGFNHNENIPPLIRKINEKAVLSNFEILSIPYNLQFTPFTRDLEFWDAYNELKHELQEKQFKITYTRVMDAFAALAALHCFAGTVIAVSDESIPKVLDRQYWVPYPAIIIKDPDSIFWKSLLFRIYHVYRSY